MRQTRWWTSILLVLVMAVLAACGGAADTAVEDSSQNQALPPTEAPDSAQVDETTEDAAPAGEPTEELGVQPSDDEAAPTVPPGEFKEAPKVAEMVSAGNLPAVAERLPKKPMVLEPIESVGKYGGTWNTALKGTSDTAWLVRTIGYENLVRWRPDVKNFTAEEVIPNIADSVDMNDEGSEYTFHLREGMKWSDGKPFTADDIMFWYEDVFSNEELTPAVPSWLTAAGKPVTVQRVDDLTVVFRFAGPNGLFLSRLATPPGDAPTAFPRHYMQQFHKKYNPQVEQQAKKAQMEGWTDLFASKVSPWENPEKPTLNAWKLTKAVGDATQQLTAERNPYYWKVDTEGNQLPYIDTISYRVTDDVEVMVLQALNGEIDMMDRHINALANKPVFFDNQEKGNYHFTNEIPASMNQMMFALNLTVRDKNKRQVFNDKNFRIGLSHAINRQEIIDAAYQSQGEPFQGAPRPESPFFNEQLAKQYTEYDVALANQFLDKVLPEKNDQGMRLGPDGKPFVFQVETAAAPTASQEGAALELMQGYFKAVGIDMRVKPLERSLFYERKDSNQSDATTWSGDGGLDVILEPRWYFPFSTESNFAIPWAIWFNNPKADGAIKPPAAAKKQMELYRQLMDAPSAEERADLMKQILQIAQEEFWVMGLALPTEGYGIVKNNFHNVPEDVVSAYLSLTPAQTNPSQYWIEGE